MHIRFTLCCLLVGACGADGGSEPVDASTPDVQDPSPVTELLFWVATWSE